MNFSSPLSGAKNHEPSTIYIHFKEGLTPSNVKRVEELTHILFNQGPLKIEGFIDADSGSEESSNVFTFLPLSGQKGSEVNPFNLEDQTLSIFVPITRPSSIARSLLISH